MTPMIEDHIACGDMRGSAPPNWGAAEPLLNTKQADPPPIPF